MSNPSSKNTDIYIHLRLNRSRRAATNWLEFASEERVSRERKTRSRCDVPRVKAAFAYSSFSPRSSRLSHSERSLFSHSLSLSFHSRRCSCNGPWVRCTWLYCKRNREREREKEFALGRAWLTSRSRFCISYARFIGTVLLLDWRKKKMVNFYLISEDEFFYHCDMPVNWLIWDEMMDKILVLRLMNTARK